MRASPLSAAEPRSRARPRALDLWLEGAALAAVLGLAALLETRDLHSGATYDEGVYLASLRELRHGVALGSPLFTSQPPGFYWLLRIAGEAGSSPAAVRSVMVAVSLGGLAALWWLVRSLRGAAAGVVAAGMLAVAPPWAVNGARIDADVPSTALALGALALARTSPVAAGALLAAAVSAKLLAVAAVVPFVLLARRSLPRAASGAAAASAAILLPTAGTLGAVWREAVTFHFDARSTGGPSTGDNLHRVLHFPDLHTPFGVLALVAIVIALAHVLLRRRLPHWELWTWTAAAAVLLVTQRPLLDHHLVLFAAALATPVAALTGDGLRAAPGRGRMLALAALLALGAAGYVQQWRQIAGAAPTDPDVARAAAFLRSHVATGSTVASDLEIVPYLAEMRQPPQLVDLSAVRLAAGSITGAAILRDSRGSAAFVVGRTVADHPAVLAALRRRYPGLVRIGSIAIYYRPRSG